MPDPATVEECRLRRKWLADTFELENKNSRMHGHDEPSIIAAHHYNYLASIHGRLPHVN